MVIQLFRTSAIPIVNLRIIIILHIARANQLYTTPRDFAPLPHDRDAEFAPALHYHRPKVSTLSPIEAAPGLPTNPAPVPTSNPKPRHSRTWAPRPRRAFPLHRWTKRRLQSSQLLVEPPGGFRRRQAGSERWSPLARGDRPPQKFSRSPTDPRSPRARLRRLRRRLLPHSASAFAPLPASARAWRRDRWIRDSATPHPRARYSRPRRGR